MTAAGGDRARSIRAALLAAVWSMSGVWTLGHALDHALHHEDAHAGVAAEAAPAVSAEAADAHGHAHPETLPVALNGKGPQPLALAVTAVVPDRPCTPQIWQRMPGAAPAHAAPWAGGPSGPRAPPIA